MDPAPQIRAASQHAGRRQYGKKSNSRLERGPISTQPRVSTLLTFPTAPPEPGRSPQSRYTTHCGGGALVGPSSSRSSAESSRSRTSSIAALDSLGSSSMRSACSVDLGAVIDRGPDPNRCFTCAASPRRPMSPLLGPDRIDLGGDLHTSIHQPSARHHAMIATATFAPHSTQCWPFTADKLPDIQAILTPRPPQSQVVLTKELKRSSQQRLYSVGLKPAEHKGHWSSLRQ